MQHFFRRFGAVLATATVALSVWALPASASAVMPSDGDATYTNVVDVSHHVTVTSWAALRQNTSVIYTKATEGTGYTDPTVASWAHGAEENGLDFGFFHYFWPGSVDYAILQADYFVSVIRQYPYTCLPVVDVEEFGGYDPATITAAVNAFRAEVTRLTGHDVMIYVSAGKIDADNGGFFTGALSPAPLWVADYRHGGPYDQTNLFSAWAMWQYTSTAVWPGLQNDGIDADKATAKIFIGGTAKTPTVAPVSTGSPVKAASGSAPGFCHASKLDGPINSTAGRTFSAKDADGNTLAGRSVSDGDPLVILGVDYATQRLEIQYPVYGEDAWYHAYIDNDEANLHNAGWHKWRNGGTDEPVYDKAGNRIGTIYPHEYATALERSADGRTHLLYSTAKGDETKDGYVWFAGV